MRRLDLLITSLPQEKLSASVRQEAERKLVALEDDLKTKEMQQKEKNNAQRYHKVRFFGEQKCASRIDCAFKPLNGWYCYFQSARNW